MTNLIFGLEYLPGATLEMHILMCVWSHRSDGCIELLQVGLDDSYEPPLLLVTGYIIFKLPRISRVLFTGLNLFNDVSASLVCSSF
jgi:hypothetical protein